MKNLVLLLAFIFLGSITYAQKDDSEKGKKEKDQDTKITPGASGVKRSIGYRFSSVTDDSDPGDGNFRYDNKKISSVTYIFVDKNDIKGEDQTNWYETWDKETGATGRGRVTLVELEGDNINVFDITDVFIEGNGYWKFPVKYVSGTLPVNDSVYFYVFERIAHRGGSDKDKEEVEPSFAEASEGREVEPVAEEVAEIIEEAPVVIAEEAEEVIEAAEPLVEEPLDEVIQEPVAEVVEEAEPVAEEVAEIVEEAPVVIAEEAEEIIEAAEPVVVIEEPVSEEVAEPSFAEASEDREVEEVEPVAEEVAEIVEEAPVVIAEEAEEIIEEAEPVVEEPVTEVVMEAPAGEVIKAPPVVVAEAPPVAEPVPEPEPKAKPAAPVAEPVDQPEKVTDVAPAPPKTETRQAPQPVREQDNKPVTQTTETKPVIKPGQETRTVPVTQPSQDTQTTVGAGRRTISSTKQPVTQPAQETKTTTITRETRTEPAKQPSQQTQTTVTARRQTVTVTQPEPMPERKPLPEPEQGPPAQIALQPVEETQKEPVTQPVPEKKYDDFPVVQNYYQSSGGRSHGKWYRGIIEIGYALRVSEYGMNNFRFNFINGFNIKNTSIGLGIGVRKYYDKPSKHPDWHLVSSDVQIPVFLDVRTHFSSKTFTPYLGIGIGGSQGFDSDTTNNKAEGLYFHATGGLWINISERFAVFGGFAYEMQKLEYANFSDEIPYKKNTNSISINIGIAF